MPQDFDSTIVDKQSLETERNLPAARASSTHILIKQRSAPAIKTAWVVLVLAVLILWILAIPLRYQQLATIANSTTRGLHQLNADEANVLSQAGIPITAYALYTTTIEVITAAVFLLIGGCYSSENPMI